MTGTFKQYNLQALKLTSAYIGGSLNVFYKDGEKNYLGHGWFRVNNEDK